MPLPDLTIRNPADATEAYHGLAALRRVTHLLDRAKHEAECAEAACGALDGFGASATAEIDAAIGDMGLPFHIRRLSEALSEWEERGTSEAGRLLVSEGI